MPGPRIVGSTTNFADLVMGPHSGRSGGEEAEPVPTPGIPDYTPSEAAMPEPGQLDALEESVTPPTVPYVPAPVSAGQPQIPDAGFEIITFANGLVAVGGMAAVLPPQFMQRIKDEALACIADYIKETTSGKVQTKRRGTTPVPEPARPRKRPVRRASRKAAKKPAKGEGQ